MIIRIGLDTERFSKAIEAHTDTVAYYPGGLAGLIFDCFRIAHGAVSRTEILTTLDNCGQHRAREKVICNEGLLDELLDELEVLSVVFFLQGVLENYKPDDLKYVTGTTKIIINLEESKGENKHADVAATTIRDSG